MTQQYIASVASTHPERVVMRNALQVLSVSILTTAVDIDIIYLLSTVYIYILISRPAFASIDLCSLFQAWQYGWTTVDSAKANPEAFQYAEESCSLSVAILESEVHCRNRLRSL